MWRKDYPSDEGVSDERRESLSKSLKNHLKLKDNKEPGSNPDDLDRLLKQLKNDKNLDDNIFEGQHGKYEVSDDYVDGGELFDKNLPVDDIKNINAALEFGMMTKAAFGDTATFLNAPADAKPEEIAIVLYATELTGCKSANPPANLDPAMKEKIDKAWEKMKNGQDAGLKNDLNPALSTEMTSTAQNKPQTMQLG